MSLIHCEECGQQVSDTANRCPHCGYRLKKGYGFSVASMVLGIISCVYAFGSLVSKDTSVASGVKHISVIPLVVIFAVLAIIFGMLSLKKNNSYKKGTAGVVMGVLSIVLSVLFEIAIK